MISIGCDNVVLKVTAKIWKHGHEVQKGRKHEWSENESLVRFWMTFIAGKTKKVTWNVYYNSPSLDRYTREQQQVH